MAEENKKIEGGPLKLTVSDNPKFPVTNDCALLTTYKLSKYVNTLFQQVFRDYVGCLVYVDQDQNNVLNNLHPVQLELYFSADYSSIDYEKERNILINSSDTNGPAYYGFQLLTEKIKDKYGNGTVSRTGKTNFFEQAMGYNNIITQNKTCVITEDGMGLMESVLWREISSKLPKDDEKRQEQFAKMGITVETVVPGQTGNITNPRSQNVVHNIVRMVDINTVLKTLFNANSNDEYVYQVSPVKPFMQQMYQVPSTDQKWLFAVHRINQRNFYDMCNEIGHLNCANGIHMYTDSYK